MARSSLHLAGTRSPAADERALVRAIPPRPQHPRAHTVDGVEPRNHSDSPPIRSIARSKTTTEDDWKATNPLAALKLTVSRFSRRASRRSRRSFRRAARAPDAYCSTCTAGAPTAAKPATSRGLLLPIHTAAALRRVPPFGSASNCCPAFGTHPRRSRRRMVTTHSKRWATITRPRAAVGLPARPFDGRFLRRAR